MFAGGWVWGWGVPGCGITAGEVGDIISGAATAATAAIAASA